MAVGTAAIVQSRADTKAQVERMASELFETMSRHRVVIMVLDRSAAEVPEYPADVGATCAAMAVDLAMGGRT